MRRGTHGWWKGKHCFNDAACTLASYHEDIALRFRLPRVLAGSLARQPARRDRTLRKRRRLTRSSELGMIPHHWRTKRTISSRFECFQEKWRWAGVEMARES